MNLSSKKTDVLEHIWIYHLIRTHVLEHICIYNLKKTHVSKHIWFLMVCSDTCGFTLAPIIVWFHMVHEYGCSTWCGLVESIEHPHVDTMQASNLPKSMWCVCKSALNAELLISIGRVGLITLITLITLISRVTQNHMDNHPYGGINHIPNSPPSSGWIRPHPSWRHRGHLLTYATRVSYDLTWPPDGNPR